MYMDVSWLFDQLGRIDNSIPMVFRLGLNVSDKSSRIHKIKYLNSSWTMQKFDKRNLLYNIIHYFCEIIVLVL
mgnify:FL=1